MLIILYCGQTDKLRLLTRQRFDQSAISILTYSLFREYARVRVRLTVSLGVEDSNSITIHSPNVYMCIGCLVWAYAMP